VNSNSQPAALTKEQIEDLRDYLMDIECPFDESIVDALCDLALKGLSGGPEGVVAMPEAIRGEWTPRRCLRLGQAAEIEALCKFLNDAQAPQSAGADDARDATYWRHAVATNMIRDGSDGVQLIQDDVAADAARSATSEQQPRHWVYAAAEAHRHRLGYLEMGDRATESKHIEWMLDQIRDAGFSPTKACRWLGWVQAALYQAGIPLEELKAINRIASEQFER